MFRQIFDLFRVFEKRDKIYILFFQIYLFFSSILEIVSFASIIPFIVVINNAAVITKTNEWNSPVLKEPSENLPIIIPAKNPCIITNEKKVVSKSNPPAPPKEMPPIPEMLPLIVDAVSTAVSFGNNHN